MVAEPQQLEADNQPADSRDGHKKWADLLRSASRPSSSFKLKKWNVEDRSIAKEELRSLGFCLVAYILGRFPGRQAVENVRKSWNVQSTCSWHDSGWLIFHFHNEEDRDSVLMKGPFETLGAPWLMKKLPPFFKFTQGSLSSVPTWIRLHGLPLECWTQNVLGKLASFVGDPLAADEYTATMARTSFARILVEVDLTQPLVKEISTCLPDGSKLVQEVVYEREPQLCSKCKRVGHNEGQCRMHPSNKKPQHTQHHLVAQGLQNPQETTELALQMNMGKVAGGRSKVRDEDMMHPSSSSAVVVEHASMYKKSAKLVQQQAELQLPAATIQPTTDRPTEFQHAPADTYQTTMQEDQMNIADHVLEGGKKAMLDAEFPPLVAKETGRKKIQTRKAAAATLPVANAQMQLQLQDPLAAAVSSHQEDKLSDHEDAAAADTAMKMQQMPKQQGVDLLQPSVTCITEGISSQQQKVVSSHLQDKQSFQQSDDATLPAATEGNTICIDKVAAIPSKMQQLQEFQPTAATTEHHNSADVSLNTAPDAAEVQVTKQPAGPKWRQNRKTRSAAKKKGSAS